MLLALLLVLGATAGCTSQSPSAPLQRSEGRKEVNGTSFYYQTIGTGTPILVLHGGPGESHRYSLPHLEPLAETHQLILFDQRGTGQSDGNLDMRAVSIGQFVEDIDALRAAFGFEGISVMGHSWGAVLALFYAFEHQERLDRLILVAPGHWADRPRRGPATEPQAGDGERSRCGCGCRVRSRVNSGVPEAARVLSPSRCGA
jgi:proline iminopeptidase